MADIKYDIVKEFGVLSENAKGWRKEVNLISWNDAVRRGDEESERDSGRTSITEVVSEWTGLWYNLLISEP